jgi:hypothetical protein
LLTNVLAQWRWDVDFAHGLMVEMQPESRKIQGVDRFNVWVGPDLEIKSF